VRLELPGRPRVGGIGPASIGDAAKLATGDDVALRLVADDDVDDKRSRSRSRVAERSTPCSVTRLEGGGDELVGGRSPPAKLRVICTGEAVLLAEDTALPRSRVAAERLDADPLRGWLMMMFGPALAPAPVKPLSSTCTDEAAEASSLPLLVAVVATTGTKEAESEAAVEDAEGAVTVTAGAPDTSCCGCDCCCGCGNGDDSGLPMPARAPPAGTDEVECRKLCGDGVPRAPPPPL